MELSEMRQLAKMVADEIESRYNADNAPKFDNGKVIVKPGDASMKDHEFDISKLMHKIVMVRDNLRVLEQQINSNEILSNGEKIKYQSYISKCYGSLTTFNFLFYYDEDKFSSK